MRRAATLALNVVSWGCGVFFAVVAIWAAIDGQAGSAVISAVFAVVLIPPARRRILKLIPKTGAAPELSVHTAAKKERNATIGTIPGLLIIAAAAWGIFKLYGVDIDFSDETLGRKQQPAEPAVCGVPWNAYVASQEFVKQQLKAPSTAKFSHKASEQQYLGDCRHFVVGTVDSQNSFGATIRSTYSVTLVYLPGEKSWKSENLIIQ